MKANVIGTIVAVAIGALLGWGFSSMAQTESDSLPMGIVVGIEVALIGIGLFGINYSEYPRSGVMVRAACAVSLIAMLVFNTVYAFVGIGTSFYVINGILMLLTFLISNAVYKSRQ